MSRIQDGIKSLYKILLKFGPDSKAKCYEIADNSYSVEIVWYETKDSYFLVLISIDPYYQIIKGIYPVTIETI